MTVTASPSKDRIEPSSVNIPLGRFPPSCSSKAIDPDKIASGIINRVNDALSMEDHNALSALFLEDGYWRDHLCLSWDLRTIKGQQNISRFLSDNDQLVKVEIDRSSAFRAPNVGPIDAFEVMGIQFFIVVTTLTGKGTGVVRLAEEGDEWKIFTFYTLLIELKGHEEVVCHRRPKGVQDGTHLDRRNWRDRRIDEADFQGKDPAVLIIGVYTVSTLFLEDFADCTYCPGAGQAGLTAGARLKMLNVDTLIIDSLDRIGDNWRRRYRQLVLHDPVWFDHMPYIPFPANWPIFTPKDKLAEFFECYVKLLELNVWTKSRLVSSSWSDEQKQWTVVLERRKEDGIIETRTLHPRHIIQATGQSGKKNLPDLKGMENFKGDRICHSSEFSGANPASKGKKAVVVGSGNSGHDICQDFAEEGYHVTMIQRSSTYVVSSEATSEIGLKALYDEDGPPVEDSDVFLWSVPTELIKAQQVKVTALQSKYDAPLLEGLEKAGFKVDLGPDNAGLLIKYLQCGGGYYINVGASGLIAKGIIKVIQGQEITEVLPHGLRLADGSELEADEIIFATGYQNMREQARILFGDNTADRIDNVWGFDKEGEMRTIWRRTGHPGFWFMGGNLSLCRYYSRVLALQIKAVEEGIIDY
ncbi:flavin-binding monooxygenase-like protein [Aspergillus terreus]|uniref:Flavin-binding monooxygenase-like protein n=1 Tax=Aspergillus terreus TaxID=33178 RepID=A0A5M3Z3T5_ASPTE|nr:hypothetical protein ATETN484_0009002000 [Aspergillus terreus]GFF17471.1 flavin-binding monooxygenase-like protein [Aspergillus terreus]